MSALRNSEAEDPLARMGRCQAIGRRLIPKDALMWLDKLFGEPRSQFHPLHRWWACLFTDDAFRSFVKYRNHVKRKIHAYHVFIQAGVVAQGLLQYLAVIAPKLVWDSFGS